MSRTLYTVKAEALRSYADSIEKFANDNLRAWIILGQSDKFSVEMADVRALRSAAERKSVWERREILRNSGFILRKVSEVGR